MSAFLGAHARHLPSGDIRRSGALAAISLAAILLVAMLAIGSASAGLPSAALRLSPADAARAGSTIQLLPRAVGSSTLLEVRPAAIASAGTGRAPSLLAISPDGSQVALADKVGELSGSLTIARGDGEQLRLQLPGLLAAGFAVDGAWLAVVDGRGALWQVDARSGRATSLADGPFLGSPIAAADGSLMLLSVPSVEAPYRSRLVRLAPSTGSVTTLSDDDLAYAAFPLSDGSVAVVAHQPGRTVVRQIGPRGEPLLADLGPGAVNVAVAPDGRRIAFELGGRGVFVIDGPGASPRSLGVGSRPCFAADGSSLLLRRGSGSVAVSLEGSLLAVTDRLAGFAGAVGCLP